MSADVKIKWIKVYTDMISNKKIKRIRTLPEGNNIVLIWVFLLAQSGECNKNGALYLTDTIPFRPEDLAVEFDFEIPVINLALITLEKFSMIEVFDEIIYIKNWDEYQNIEALGKIKIGNRERKRKERATNQLLLQEKEDVTRDVTQQVTQSHATEIDIELEIEKEIEVIPYSEIVTYLNLENSSKYKSTSAKTRDCIKARWNEGFRIDDFKVVIDKKVASWTNTDMDKFLRPETLFGTKFEGYLNEKTFENKPRGRLGVTEAEGAGIRRDDM